MSRIAKVGNLQPLRPEGHRHPVLRQRLQVVPRSRAGMFPRDHSATRFSVHQDVFVFSVGVITLFVVRKLVQHQVTWGRVIMRTHWNQLI
jgi:hypothetical protein